MLFKKNIILEVSIILNVYKRELFIKNLFFLFLISVLLISLMKNFFATSNVTTQMNSRAFYQKPIQSWSEYLKERKDDIIRTALIGTAVIGVGVVCI